MTIILNQQAFDILRKYHIPTLDYREIEHFSDLKKHSYPLVLKVNSLGILHKTEKKAVRICQSITEAEKNFSEMRKLGQVISQPLFEGRELILGISTDSVFGQVIMFGLGGIFTEVLKDISFRACPITNSDALEMISEIKGSKILEEFRGQKPIDKNFLAETLVKLSNLAVKEKVKTLDINPFTVKEGTHAKAIDARIIL